MASEFQQVIDRVSAKMQILLDRYAIVNRRREEALARIDDLEREVVALTEQNRRLQAEVEFLKVATTISPDRADVEATRATLSRLVREIDKCITELND